MQVLLVLENLKKYHKDDSVTYTVVHMASTIPVTLTSCATQCNCVATSMEFHELESRND